MNILKTTLLIFTMGFTTLVKAQLTTTNTLTPTQLVQQVLLGQGVTATNIQFTGNPNQIAKFNATANTNLGLGSGILISSGDARTSSINGPQGPNSSGGTSTSYTGAGDVDLNTIISPKKSYDAAILEFDFVPNGDSVKFRYFFGSEEYPEFVNSSYNDAFAFLLTGPDPLGGNYTSKNIALIPGTSTPVTIDNVNAGLNSSFYRSNTGNAINGEYDGYTTVMYALERVVCGQTYHIKLAIADGGLSNSPDYTYDSGVFLEANSLSSTPPLSLNTNNASSLITDTLLFEDCNTYCVKFVRTGNIAVADSFGLSVGGNAINGSDYATLTNTVLSNVVWPSVMHFAANQDTFKICDLKIMDDATVEALDTLIFTVNKFTSSATACVQTNTITLKLYLSDYTPLTISAANQTICAGQTTLINATVANGKPAYTYNWMPGAVTTNTFATGAVNSNQIYTITANDICNKPITNTVSVSATQIPTVSVTNATICAGKSATLVATTIGGTMYSWNNNVSLNNDTNIVTPASTNNYTVIAADGTCTNSAVSTVSVINTTITINGLSQICDGVTTTLSATGANSYNWSNGILTSSISVMPSITTTYSVIGSIQTCTFAATHLLTVNPIPTVAIISSSICLAQTATLTAHGAATYTWNTGFVGGVLNDSPTTTTNYSVIGATAFNCTNTANYNLIVVTTKPKISPISSYTICIDSNKVVPLVVTSGYEPYTINWINPIGGLVPYDTIGYNYYVHGSEANQYNYQIKVKDGCNLKDSATFDITVVDCTVIVPNVMTVNGDGVNDVFKIQGVEYFSNTIVNVYNRWGKSVYSSSDYKNDWKPELNQGTYFYVVLLNDGRKFNGFIEIIN